MQAACDVLDTYSAPLARQIPQHRALSQAVSLPPRCNQFPFSVTPKTFRRPAGVLSRRIVLRGSVLKQERHFDVLRIIKTCKHEGCSDTAPVVAQFIAPRIHHDVSERSRSGCPGSVW
jgi:hypothetical protein